jgi:excinuclease ABC subunit A
VVVIEHNLEVIKTADWVIDLGPEAGNGGGDLVAAGTPESIVGVKGSHTGRFLEPVLAAGPLAERAKFDPKAALRGGLRSTGDKSEPAAGKAKPNGNSKSALPSPATADKGKKRATVESTSVSPSPSSSSETATEVKAPWEIDGRKWHTGGRPASNGRPTRWDGRLLDWIVTQIEGFGGSNSRLLPADWSQRNVVRIISSDHDTIRFPFFHATTSSEWVVTVRFFVPKNTFRLEALEKQLGLVPFHESSPPVLCDQPRVKFENVGPFQVITIVGYSLDEIQTEGFKSFVRKAVAAFQEIGRPRKIKKASELA